MQIPSFISFCWWKLLYSPIKSLENHAMTSVKWLYIIYIYSGESDLVGLGIVIRIKTFPVQTPSEAWLGLGTQHHYKAPNDLRAKNVKRQWLTCGELAVLQIMDARQQLLIVWEHRLTKKLGNWPTTFHTHKNFKTVKPERFFFLFFLFNST